MARQNVGTPRFYIDYFQYWYHKGAIAGVGPYGDHNYGDLESGINWLTDVMPGGSAWHPEILGLNPAEYMRINRNPTHSNNGTTPYIPYCILFKDRVEVPDSGQCWQGFLNHKLYTNSVTANPSLGFKRTRCYQWLDWITDDNLNEYGTPSGTTSSDYHSLVVNISAADYGVEEIYNFPCDDKSQIGFNGFSLMEFPAPSGVNDNDSTELSWHPGQTWGRGCDLIFMDHVQGDSAWLDEDYENNNVNVDTYLGSWCFGAIYEPPVSADLELTMSRVYDGVENITTSGGANITNVLYDGPPFWNPSMPAWGGHTLTSMHSDSHWNWYQDGSRGRRMWELSFSYIDHKNLFAVNELGFRQNASDAFTNGGYDSDDYSGTNYTQTIETDVSFYGAVIHKTLGGKLPFIFQPDKNNNSPDQFAICILDMESIDVQQVAHNTYSISLKIKEVW